MDQYGAFRYSGISAVPEEREFDYDGENRLIRLEIGSEISYYSYDPSGERVSASESGGSTYFYFARYEVTPNH
jgi:hypothetical protein